MQWHIILISWLAFIGSTIAITNAQQTIVVGNSSQPIVLNSMVEVYEASEELTPFQVEERIRKNSMVKCKQKCSHGFSEKYYWIHFSIHNNRITNENLFLIIENPHIDSALIYRKQSDNTYLTLGKSGDQLPFFERTIYNRNMVFLLPFKANETIEFLMLIDKRNASVSFPLTLRDRDNFLRYDQRSNLINGISIGMLLFISFFSLFIGRILWQKIFLSYGLYVLFITAYIFVNRGYGFQFIYPDFPEITNYVRTLLYKTFNVFVISFSINYLNMKELKPSIPRLLYGTLIAEVLISLVILLLSKYIPHNIVIILNINYLSFLIQGILLGYFLLSTLRQQPFNNLSYAFSVGFVVIAVLLTILIEYGLIQQHQLPVPLVMYGAVIEIFLLSIFLVFKIKEVYDHRFQLMREVNDHKGKMMQAYVRGIDEERKHLSQELHDNIGAQLVILKNKLTDSSINSEIIDIIKDVRQLSHQLSPATLPLLGFEAAITKLVNDYRTTLPITLNFFSLPELSTTLTLQLYRVLQEALKNIAAHSEATEATIQFFGYPDQLIVTIEDNGQGMHLEKDNIKNGIGLNNMKSRIESVNGTFEITSSPGKGVNILITIPLPT